METAMPNTAPKTAVRYWDSYTYGTDFDKRAQAQDNAFRR